MFKENIVIVGAGAMGKVYVQNLLQLSVESSQLVLVDVAMTSFMEAYEKEYPEEGHTVTGQDPIPFAFQNLEAAEKPTVAFVLVNTPAHASVIEQLAAEGVTHFFVEKPLVFSVEELALIERLEAQGCVFYTAFLFNFSGAVEKVRHLMEAQELVLLEARGFHGKNRTADNRATAGDDQDELCHLLQLALALASVNQTREGVHASGLLSRHSFFDRQAQQAAHTRDQSFPLHPVSSANVMLASECETRDGQSHLVQMVFMSSFMMPLQHRTSQLVLGTAADRTPVYSMEINFDMADGDVLTSTALWRNEAGKPHQPVVESFRVNKIRAEIEAFLQSIAGEVDSRLTTSPEAADIVRLTAGFSGSSDLMMKPFRI